MVKGRVIKRGTYTVLSKIIIIVFVSFILSSIVLWLFFRSTARNIGNYLRGPDRRTATMLIEDYLGAPPSRFKAFLLNKMYHISFEYYRDGELIWRVGETAGFDKMMEMHRRMMGGRGKMGGFGVMGKGHAVQEIDIGSGERIVVYYPLYEHRKIFLIPLIILVFALGIIVLVIYYLTKRTLNPIRKLIEASKRIGDGDLSYRINYDKDDEFKSVVVAFNSMAKKLETMLKDQRELLHLLSHELKTPLARINLALELDDREKAYRLIQDEVRGMSELIESIMDLSRIDYDQIGMEKVNLVDLINEQLKREKEYRDIAVEVNLPSEDALIPGKRVLIEKVVGNIMENAFKYSDGREPIKVRLYRDGDSWMLSVINTGRGLREEECKRIFSPFYRGQNSGQVKGKGLGLVVVHRVLDYLGGSVRCISRPEGPTEFLLKFPAG